MMETATSHTMPCHTILHRSSPTQWSMTFQSNPRVVEREAIKRTFCMKPDTRLISITWDSLSTATTKFSSIYQTEYQHQQSDFQENKAHVFNLVHRNASAHGHDLLTLKLLLSTSTLQSIDSVLHQFVHSCLPYLDPPQPYQTSRRVRRRKSYIFVERKR